MNEFENEILETPTDEGGVIAEKPGEETENELGDASTDEAEAIQTEHDSNDEESGEELNHPDDPKGVKKRIDKAVRREKEAREELARQREELAEIKAHLAKLTAPAQKAEAPLVEPQPEEFENWKDFVKAHKEYAVKVEEKQREQFEEQQVAQYLQQINENFKKQYEAMGEKYDDFYDVVHAKDLEISKPVLDAVKASPYSGELIYYLGKNKPLASKLYDMHPFELERAIGRIEAKFEKPPAKVKSNASTPTKPLSGGGIAGAVTIDRLNKAAEQGDHDEFSKMYREMIKNSA